MNKQLIVYMPLMILCMLKMKELKKMLEEIVQFFVLQLLKIVLPIDNGFKTSIINVLNRNISVFQFFVSDYRFSVLVL
jgi:hypothetical protein